MDHIYSRLKLVVLALVALMLAGCAAGEGPKRIAAFFTEEGVTVEERFIPLPDHEMIVYNADIELQVADPDAAAGRAKDLAAKYGGYLVSSTSWTQDGARYHRLVIAVPVPYFEQLRGRLLDLGDLARESVWGDKAPYRPSGGHNYSTITLQLIPKQSAWPRIQISGWNPGETFRRASAVFISIFGFLVDILIWLVVVAGPFLLIGFLLWWTIVKRRQKRESDTDVTAEG